MQKVMFDSNTFTHFIEAQLDQDSFFEKSREKYEYYVSAVQAEELAKIGDDKKEKRIKHILCLCQMRAKLVHPLAVLGYARLGFCVLADEYDNTYESLLNENRSNVADAMIGEVAKREGCILITDDKRFIKKLHTNEIQSMTLQEFLDSVNNDGQVVEE